jgi:magnesium transporter
MNTETVGNVKNILVNCAKDLEIIDYIYIIDNTGILKGVVSIRELLQSDADIQIDKMIKRKPITVNYFTDQERIIYLVLDHELKAIPVVNNENHLVGVVPYRAIINIFHNEFREDILKSGGIHHHIKEIEDITTPAKRLIKARLPSLIIGLVGGLLAAYVVRGFEDILSSYLTLAAFIPVIVYLSDAVGTQSQTLIVRMIALEPNFSFRNYMSREIKIGSILGITLGVILFTVIFIAWLSINIGVIIGISIFLSMLFQAFVSTSLSILLTKFRIDPAISSGPITTIMSDITTLVIYFSIATLFLRSL